MDRAYLGKAQNIVVRLCCAGDLRILEAISDTEYPPLVLGEKRSLVIKVHPGNPTDLTASDIKSNQQLLRGRAIDQLNRSQPRGI